MVNNFTKTYINITSDLSPSLDEHKTTTIYDVGNPDLSLERTQKWGGVKFYTTDAVHGASLGEPNLTIFLL